MYALKIWTEEQMDWQIVIKFWFFFLFYGKMEPSLLVVHQAVFFKILLMKVKIMHPEEKNYIQLIR